MIALVSAPSNLGLRPPRPGSVPGTAKAPEALREAGLWDRLLAAGAYEAGIVLPGRYVDDDDVRPPGRVRNQDALVDHARRLANRLASVLEAGDAPLVIGGDCSLLVGIGLALARRGPTGLVHIDGHTDFRHPGNSDACASLAGEDLAAAIGRHWPAVADLDGLAPYFPPQQTAHLGHRDDDEHAAEVREAIGLTMPARDLTSLDPDELAGRVREVAGEHYWLQVDVDVLDPSVLPAVDSPDPGGLNVGQLVGLLGCLAPSAVGASVTVFDPDLDPDGRYARLLCSLIADGFAGLGLA